MTLYT